jgi:hypothetical protein
VRATAEEWTGLPLSFSFFFLLSLFISPSPLGGSALAWSAHGRPAVGVATRHVEDASVNSPALLWPRRSKASGSQRHALSHDRVVGFPSGIIR